MQPLDAVYLQILKNLCTDLSEPVPLDGVDPSALYRLAEKHCSLPFLLPYFEQQPQFSALKQQTKQMLLSYYQLEHFTRLTFSLLLAEKIPCFLLKGISLAANYPIPEYRKLGDLDLYIPEKDAFSRACRILNAHGYTEEPEESDGPTITVNGKEIQAEGSSVTVGGVTIITGGSPDMEETGTLIWTDPDTNTTFFLEGALDRFDLRDMAVRTEETEPQLSPPTKRAQSITGTAGGGK